jgi:hypothetical protein
VIFSDLSVLSAVQRNREAHHAASNISLRLGASPLFKTRSVDKREHRPIQT